MTKSGVNDVLLLLLQMIGKDWEDNARPEDIRLSSEKIDALKSVNALVANGTLDAGELRASSPAFVTVYQQVMLRDIEEHINHGSAHS